MGKTYRIYLNGRRVYGCNKCKTHLTLVECLISKVGLPFLLSSWVDELIRDVSFLIIVIIPGYDFTLRLAELQWPIR